MSRVEIVVNGEVVRSESPGTRRATGHSSVHIERSSWIALLVRGHYRDKPEVIAAHSSPVIVEVKGSPFFAAADALTILDQIEGALTYLDTLGTRAEAAARKRMRMELTSAHRRLHNQMHQNGVWHEHAPGHNHAEH